MTTADLALEQLSAPLRSLLDDVRGLDEESQCAVASLVHRVAAQPEASDGAFNERRVMQAALLAAADDLGEAYEEILSRPAPPVLPQAAHRRCLSLPGDVPRLEHSLSDVLSARASRRDFMGAPLRLEELGALLHHSYGVRGGTRAYGAGTFPLRAAPSAGGLQSANLYVVALSVEGLASGAYAYLPATNELGLVDTGVMRRPMVAACLRQEWVASAAAVLVLTFDVTRGEWKYGSRVLRFGFMDVGFLGENLYLVATALGLRTCAVAGYREE